MAKPLVIFRADGHAEMGLGHLIRSSALAQMLNENFACHLIYHTCPEALLRQFSAVFLTSKVAVSAAGSVDDANETISYGEQLAKDGQTIIFVTDGYHFRADYQRTIKARGYALVCIDDIYQDHFICDLVINHAPSRGLREKYSHEPNTALALGLDYCLLRPPFLSAAIDYDNKADGGRKVKRRNFFICFGGSDFGNISQLLIENLAALGYDNPIDLVLGPANAHRVSVMEAARRYEGVVNVHASLSPNEMIALMQNARLAFLPASTIMLEGIACGVPIVGGYYVDNQLDVYAGFLAKELIVGIDDWNAPTDLGERIALALGTERHAWQQKFLQWMDGHSAANLRLAFHQLSQGDTILLSRSAKPTDAKLYFEWANEPGVRQNSISSEPIAWSDHLAWFSKQLAAKNSELYLFSVNGQYVGQVRFSLTDQTAKINYSVDAGHRGKGYGKRILRLSERLLSLRKPRLRSIIADVKLDNVPSIKVFERLGYTSAGNRLEGTTELSCFLKRL